MEQSKRSREKCSLRLNSSKCRSSASTPRTGSTTSSRRSRPRWSVYQKRKFLANFEQLHRYPGEGLRSFANRYRDALGVNIKGVYDAEAKGNRLLERARLTQVPDSATMAFRRRDLEDGQSGQRAQGKEHPSRTQRNASSYAVGFPHGSGQALASHTTCV